jgi:hypothetical protein
MLQCMVGSRRRDVTHGDESLNSKTQKTLSRLVNARNDWSHLGVRQFVTRFNIIDGARPGHALILSRRKDCLEQRRLKMNDGNFNNQTKCR